MFYRILFLLLIFACHSKIDENDTASDKGEAWESLFDGKSLQGWTPKIAGQKLGQDSLQTFRVEDSMIQVRYDKYQTFENQFGHLFFKEPFEHYVLSLEYRFVGEQLGDMEWAFMNSGVMYHTQAPETMATEQAFPVSLEGQFLGARPMETRPTGNLCTPGYHVYMHDSLVTRHCIEASAPSILKDVWVEATFIIHGADTSYHLINGDTVLAFSKPIVGGDFLPKGYPDSGQTVQGGYIALQSESHPIDFRNIRIKRLN